MQKKFKSIKEYKGIEENGISAGKVQDMVFSFAGARGISGPVEVANGKNGTYYKLHIISLQGVEVSGAGIGEEVNVLTFSSKRLLGLIENCIREEAQEIPDGFYELEGVGAGFDRLYTLKKVELA